MVDGFFGPNMAMEIVSLPGNWINSDPITPSSIQGKAVLLDFWSYSCSRCIRRIRMLNRAWEERGNDPIIFIGIHTPRFSFEQHMENLSSAVRRLGIEYPVMNDPVGENWKKFGNNEIPMSIFISPGKALEIPAGMLERYRRIAGMEMRPFFMTGEVLAGKQWNPCIGSIRIFSRESCDSYYDPGNHREGIIYLGGDWNQEIEYIESPGNSGHISIRFNAREADAVMDGSGHAEVFYLGEILDPEIAGKDIIFKRGRSFVSVNGPRSYSLLTLEKYMPGELKIVPFPGIRIYSFEFG